MGTFDTSLGHDLFDLGAIHGTITVPATLDNLDHLFELIHQALEKAGCPATVRNQLDVVLEEVFVNVCSYAYAKGDAAGECRVDYVCRDNPKGIVIRVIDWGIPFDPLGHADPESPKSIAEARIGGLGILMVKRMTDRVSYLRHEGANMLTFKKNW